MSSFSPSPLSVGFTHNPADARIHLVAVVGPNGIEFGRPARGVPNWEVGVGSACRDWGRSVCAWWFAS